jgi:phosphate/sulfate permease
MNAEPAILENLRWAHAPSEGLPLWAWVLLPVLAAALGAGVFFWLRRKRRDAEEAAQAARPAHEKALEALATLRGQLSEENTMAFIIEVSRILRVYIQDRFELRAPHRSTEEFLAEASVSERLSPGDQELLGDFLRQCDLVKFARRSAALRQMETLFRTAEQFVHDTTGPEPAVQAAATP